METPGVNFQRWRIGAEVKRWRDKAVGTMQLEIGGEVDGRLVNRWSGRESEG